MPHSVGVPASFISKIVLTAACLLACTDDPGADTGTGTNEEDTSTSDDSDTTAEAGSCLGYPTSNAVADVFVRNGATAGESCPLDVAPCGGDPAGVWTFGSSCGPELVAPGNPWEMQCPGANYTPTAVRRTGVLAISVAGEWELEVSSVVDFEYGADISCLGLDCGPDAEAGLTAQGGSATCSGFPTACDCTVTDFPFETMHLAGTLGPGGMTLDPEGNENPIPYCVEDDSLKLWTLTGSATWNGETCGSDGDCTSDAATVGVCMPD